MAVRLINHRSPLTMFTSATQGQTLVVVPFGVLGNDSDPNGDPLTALLVTGSANGNLILAANGSFTYTPSANFTGVDTFTYKANDGEPGLGDLATVIISVTPPPACAAGLDGRTRPGYTTTLRNCHTLVEW